MDEQIVLFDLPSREPRSCWSYNPWKTRLLLNYKGLDYRTEWVEYPDIQPRLEPHLPPNPTHPTRDYTIPALLLPPSTYLMDSKTIAAHLETLHPSPPLHLTSPILSRLEALMPRVLRPLQPVYIPRVPRRILGEGSIPYFLSTRERDLGMTLGEYEAAKPWEGCWDAAGGAIAEVTGLLEEGGEGGPFFMGAEVSYADFVWGGFLLFCKRLGEEVWAEVLVRSGNADAHRALLKGLEKWTARDGE